MPRVTSGTEMGRDMMLIERENKTLMLVKTILYKSEFIHSNKGEIRKISFYLQRRQNRYWRTHLVILVKPKNAMMWRWEG